jgi:hypothetical protein
MPPANDFDYAISEFRGTVSVIARGKLRTRSAL